MFQHANDKEKRKRLQCSNRAVHHQQHVVCLEIKNHRIDRIIFLILYKFKFIDDLWDLINFYLCKYQQLALKIKTNFMM